MPTTARAMSADPTRIESDTPMFAGPSFAGGRTTTSSRRASGRVPPIAVAGAIVLLAGLAAAGWYATRPHDQSVAMVTPGALSEPAPIPQPAEPLAQAPAPAPAEPGLTVTTKTPAPADAAPPSTAHRAAKVIAPARARPTNRAADASGVNASATLPAAPQPYAGPVQPAPAPVIVAPPPAETPLPTQTAPPPAPPTQTPPN